MNLWEQIKRRNGEPEATFELPPRETGAPGIRPRTLEPPRQAKPTPARSLLRPLPLLGVLLVLIALAGYLGVYAQTTQRSPVLVAARDLPAGSVLRAGDLRVAKLAGDRATMAGLVPAGELDRVLGRALRSGLAPGTPLAAAALARPAARPAAFTLAVPALHALGGALEPGDRVTVLATFETSSGQARTRALARGLVVLAVGGTPTGFDRASALIPVTLALPDPALASALALANSAAKIDLLREGSNTAAAPIPPASEGQP